MNRSAITVDHAKGRVSKSPGTVALSVLAAVAVGSVSLVVGYVARAVWSDNRHEVVYREVWRAGQMNGDTLDEFIRENGIRSVLNLRGVNADEAWYRDELRVSRRAGVNHFDARLSAGEEVSLAKMEDLVALLKVAPKPLLIHCSGGADRSGLACALYRFGVEGCTAGEAGAELSVFYGHTPFLRPQVSAMDRAFDRFVGAKGDRTMRRFAR